MENAYLAARSNELLDLGIRISEGEADIVIPLREDVSSDRGNVLDALCISIMNDAAYYAVNSLVGHAPVATVSFNASLTRAHPAGDLLARGRFVGMSADRYLADSILTDSAGTEVGRGEGEFTIAEGGQPPG